MWVYARLADRVLQTSQQSLVQSVEKLCKTNWMFDLGVDSSVPGVWFTVLSMSCRVINEQGLSS